MSRPYGRLPHGSRKQPDAPQPVEIRVNLTLRHSMEQLALEVQRAIAMVEECGAAGVERFRFALLPLDEDGQPIILHDRQGQQVTTINIPDAPPEPVYRANEPGVGVLTAQPRTLPKTRHNPSR